MDKKLTLVNITGQDLVVGFVDGKKKTDPMEPVIIKAHGELALPKKDAEQILKDTPNVKLKK